MDDEHKDDNRNIMMGCFFVLGIAMFAMLAIFYLPKINIGSMFQVNFEADDAPANCVSNPNPLFPKLITDMNMIKTVVPPGTVVSRLGENVMNTNSTLVVNGRVPVYAPVDSYFYKGAYYSDNKINQYQLFFNFSCEVFYLFDHLQDPVDKIKTVMSVNPANSIQTQIISQPVYFAGGELIGYTGVNFDFGLYNRKNNNELEKTYSKVKFSLRDHQALCPFGAFHESIRSYYTSKYGSINPAEPAPKALCQ